MDGIKIEVTGNIARIIERPARITAGTVGLPVEFSFDNQWEGLSKTAVFKAGCTEKIVENLEAETAVPLEVTANPNVWLSIGVYGVNEDVTVAIPTIWANVCVICEGVNPDGDVSTAPTLPVWQRLWNSIGNLLGLTTNAKGNLVEAINEVNNIALAGGIESDATLTKSGKAADAKATGDAIKSLTAEDVGAAPIPHSASGEVISVSDSDHAPLQGLKIYGKTTQNGTPTPSAPVPLDFAGESGSVGVTVAGKNLLGRDGTNITDGSSYSGITFHENGDGTFRVSGTCTDAFVRIIGDVILPAGTYTVSQANGTMSYMAYQLWEVAADGSLSNNRQVDASTPKQTFTLTQTTKLHARFFANTGAAPNNFTVKVQIEVGETATEWEAHKPTQNLTASTEGGLHGIGDVCDEIDFARGVRVQRFYEVDMGTLTIQWVEVVKQFFAYLPTDKPMKEVPDNATAIKAFCTAYPVDAFAKRSNYDYVITAPANLSKNVRINDKRYGEGQATEMKAALSGVKLIYELATPMETPLSAQELAAFAALHSHKPNTTAFNDSNAEMEIRYCTPNAAVPMNVGSGAKGKVLTVDEHGCVVPNDVTSVGAAPAGYGYGEVQNLKIWNDTDGTQLEALLDSFFDDESKKDKVYRFSLVDYPICEVSGQGGFADIMCSDMANGVPSNITIVFHGHHDVSIATKRKTKGSWMPWEYLNPPMIVGNEYRTTERWNGHAVYTTIIDCGTPPSKSTKSVTMPSYVAPTRIIGWSGYVGHWGVSLPATASGWDVQITSYIIAIATDSDRSYDSTDNKVYITIKYTKY